MKIWGPLLSFILFCVIGLALGFQMSRLSTLQNELRNYVIAVEIHQRFQNNEIASARALLRHTIASQNETIEALAETDAEMYEYYRERLPLIEQADDTTTR